MNNMITSANDSQNFIIRVLDNIPLTMVNQIDTLLTEEDVSAKAHTDYQSKTVFYSFDMNNGRSGFHVICEDINGNVVGCLMCMSSIADEYHWMHTNLHVKKEYRRRHIATGLLTCTISEVQRRGGRSLCCTVYPKNTASICLHQSMHFQQQKIRDFDDYISAEDDDIYFEMAFSENTLAVYSNYPRAAYFIRHIYEANLSELHGKPIPLSEWDAMLEQDDSDEINLLILDQTIPCAWLKINGLDHPDTAWISMLAVLPSMKGKGIGTFALEYTEKHLADSGKNNIRIRTTQDNLPAQALYRKCGYQIIDDSSYITADGVMREGLIFSKKI